MHPILIDLGRFKLHSYGLMMFIAFVVGIYIAHRRGKKWGFPEGAVLDICTAIIISGLVGSRLLYIFTHLSEFKGRWLDTFNPFQSDGQIGIAGLVFLGGVILSLATMYVMARIRKIPMMQVYDVFAPTLPLGVGFGRIGCFLNGCCFGQPTDAWWGIIFPAGECPAGSVFPHTAIHPTQLIASASGFIIFAIVLLAEKKFRTHNGFSTGLVLFLLGFYRFFNEMIRYHDESLYIHHYHDGFFTISQGISLGLMIIGAGVFFITRKLQDSNGAVIRNQRSTHDES